MSVIEETTYTRQVKVADCGGVAERVALPHPYPAQYRAEGVVVDHAVTLDGTHEFDCTLDDKVFSASARCINQEWWIDYTGPEQVVTAMIAVLAAWSSE